METMSAIALINQVIYKPGWKISASDHTNRFEGSVRVRFEYPAYNSNRDQASAGYPECITTYAEFPMVVVDCDDTAIYRKLIECIACIEQHEAREFLRVAGTYWAPFHPHRIDGMRRWGDLTGDLQFGIA